MSDATTPESEPSPRQWLGFWSMIVQQTQNAFNDKLAQFILIPLGAAVGVAVESQAGMLIALPYVLFAPIAGWLSDRFSKRDVLLGSAALQVLVLGWICGAIVLKSLPLAMGGFFALATQAAFFSPAKIGSNKELVGSKHLGFAAGIQQMTSMLALLVGQIVGGWWFDKRYHALGGTQDMAWFAALVPLIVLNVLAAPAVIMAWIIPRVPAQGSTKFSAKLVVSHFLNLRDLWSDVPLRQASFGVAFFWGFAAYINLWSIKLAKILTGGGDGFGTLSSIFMAAASLGMVVGFGFASWLLRRRIELGWVPVAGVAMTIASLALALIPPGTATELLALLEKSPWAFCIHSPSSALFLLALGLLALFGALFLAPLTAWMQDRYPAEQRGELQSATNLQDCLAGIIAVAVIVAFELGTASFGIAPLIGARLQMGFIALTCLLATVLIIRLLPADFIRVIGVACVRAIYHIRTSHAERLPAKGGVLMLPNHVTFADAFFISAASPRPVRFVMDEAFIAQPAIRVFTELFDTLTIRRDQPLEAIREIIRALKRGDAVCLFPEGQLTRTGTLCPLQRGFELIAKKAGHPLIPMWCDGSWGSVFSFERNAFISKLPRRMGHGMTVAYGEEMHPADATLETVRAGMFAASADAVAKRFASRPWTARQPRANNPATVAFRGLAAGTRRRMWINGHQLGMVNALQRRQPFYVLKDDPLLTTLPGLFATFPALFGAEVCVRETFDGDKNGCWVGGGYLRGCIQTSPLTAATLVFYDFGRQAVAPLDREGVCHCPCLAVDGTVIAMSMPHPPTNAAGDFEPQLGHKPCAWGKLLPGWYLESGEDGSLRVRGPAAPTEGFGLPAGAGIDADGFLTPP